MSEAARELAAQRKRIDHDCPVCGATFRAIKTAVYCSNACRQKAKYQRKPPSGDSDG